MSKPSEFVVEHAPKGAKAGRVWRVKQDGNWRSAVEVSILVPVLTQPDGALVGDGVVTCTERGHITINA